MPTIAELVGKPKRRFKRKVRVRGSKGGRANKPGRTDHTHHEPASVPDRAEYVSYKTHSHRLEQVARVHGFNPMQPSGAGNPSWENRRRNARTHPDLRRKPKRNSIGAGSRKTGRKLRLSFENPAKVKTK